MHKLLVTSLLLAATVILLGAYTRLTDAGLGCPDWPGCYGQLTVPQSTEDINRANSAFPDAQIEPQKAWNEMIHRYCASLLGLLILIMTVIAWRRQYSQSLRRLLSLLLLLVIFQGILGMWTVTLKLMPLVVTAHLLGGFTTITLLLLSYFSLRTSSQAQLQQPTSLKPPPVGRFRRLKQLAALSLAVLVIQIALGGWTSSNYAALVCHQLPACGDGWVEQLDINGAFAIHLPTEAGFEYGVLDYGARMTIHMTHRIGALITLLLIGALIWQLYRHLKDQPGRRLSLALAAVLCLQVSLGLANILLHLPLSIAVAHNGIAALLLLLVATTNYHLYQYQPSHTVEAPRRQPENQGLSLER